MNRLPFGIGDFVATFKGDYEGHPFRGNQYDGGSGSESGISPDKISTAGDLMKYSGAGEEWTDVSKLGLHTKIGSTTLGTVQKVKILKIRKAYRDDEIEIRSDALNKAGQNIAGTISLSTKLSRK